MMTTLMAILPVFLPLLGAVVYAVLGWGRTTAWVGTLCTAGMLAASAGLTTTVLGADEEITVGGLVRIDALSCFMLLVIGVIGVLANVAGPAHLRTEMAAGRATRRTAARHSLLLQAFVATMAMTVLAADLGLMWAAVEATTIATAFLVGQRRTRTAVEAAWKYVVICSVGIALAFLGTILLHYVSLHAGAADSGTYDQGLDWAALVGVAGDLDQDATKIAVALLIVGFGTKAGLAPLHAWLPDAHGQAPAPVSALMSGVLLSVAFYAILRVKAIADPALGVEFTRTLLVVLALASLAIAASLLLAQRDYKRMLAYSSMEHMGLMVLGAAAGTELAVAAVLLHVLGHGLGKTVLFLSSGRILQSTGTHSIHEVAGLSGRHPLLAGVFGCGVLALIGLPPFSLFASSLGIATAGYATGLGWATTTALVLMLIAAAALLTHTARMVLGTGDRSRVTATTESATAVPRSLGLALVGGLVLCAVIGTTLGPLDGLLQAAAATVGAR